jgi:ATP-binding cassette subfamily B protein
VTAAARDAIDPDRHPIRTILDEYARPYARYFVFGTVLGLLARIPGRAPAVILGVAVDALLRENGAYSLPLVPTAWLPRTANGQFWFTVAVLSAAILLRALFDWLGRLSNAYGTINALHDIRTGTYDTVMGLEMGYFDDTASGETLSVLNNDVNNLQNLQGAYGRAMTFGGQIVVSFVFMALLNWQLALVLVSFPGALAVASRVYSRLLESRYTDVRESVGDVNARLADAIAGVGTIKANTQENHERDRVADQSRAYLATNWATIRLRLAFNAATWGMGSLTTAGLFLLGGYWVLGGPPGFLTGSLTAGTLLTFLLYAQSFLVPVRQLATDVIDTYENAHASAKRVVSTLTSTRTIDDDGEELAVTDGDVAYDGVSFGYDETETLSDIDFTVESGEFVGIVGSTGAGKSTMLKLLFRFYDPDEGTIRIDGQDTSSATVRSVRDAIGYVSQDPFLFYGTVRENIAYAETEADHEEIVTAAKLAGAHEFVTELEDGYDTEVGERGVKLSGGQRQRIAIARAILRDPEILVLDEATSHVDNETELQIQRSLDAIAGDRTTFAVAHRLSTVRDADRILVLDDGRLVESGSHEALLDRDGIYADLWRVQVGDFSAVSDTFVDGTGEFRADGGTTDEERGGNR